MLHHHPPPPWHHRRVPGLHPLNSHFVEALAEMPGLSAIHNLEVMVQQYEPRLLPILQEIQRQGVSDPRTAILLLQIDEAIERLRVLRDLTLLGSSGQLAVLLPLPPHLTDRLLPMLDVQMVLTTEEDLPPHLRWRAYEAVDRLLPAEVLRRLETVEGVVFEAFDQGSGLQARRSLVRVLQQGFAKFAPVALAFTAVAVPAHMLQRAGVLRRAGMLLGEKLGVGIVRWRLPPLLVVPAACLVLTYAIAGLLHNTTAILVMTDIIITVCQSYDLRPRPVLCGALVASNLGGFSTRWGDTPNIIEAALWGLQHGDFAVEILPVNLGLIVILCAAVSAWLWYKEGGTAAKDTFETAYALVRFRRARHSIPVDRRLLAIGGVGLLAAVGGPMLLPVYEFTFLTLASIFLLAEPLTRSPIGIGSNIRGWLEASGMAIWAIVSASYVGTLFTEAASWASAVAPIVHQAAPTHAAAWALGAGICAGSSSLVTAASAGIILTRETQGHGADARVTFGSYLPFGLSFSLGMLGYYVIVLSIIW